MKNKAAQLLGRIKKESTRNTTKPYRFRHAGRIDKYFRTKDDAETFQSNYSEQEARVGVDTATLFEDPKLLKASERAFTLLREKGIQHPEALVDAVKSFISTLPPMGYKTTLAQAIDALKQNPDYRDKAVVTKRDYNRYCSDALRFFGPEKTFSALSSMDWKDFLDEQRKTSNNAHNKALRHVSLFYGRYWIPMGYATKNPLKDGATTPKIAKHEVAMKEIYSYKEIEAIKAIASGDTSELGQRNYLAFLVQAYTGIRGEEVEKLTFEMFCDRNSSFHMRPKRIKLTLPSSITKKGDCRQIEICTKLRQELFLLPYFSERLIPATEANESEAPIYGFKMRNIAMSERCFPAKIVQFRRALQQWCKEAQVPYKGNSLRATYTSHALHGLFRSAPNPDQKLQNSLGHRLGSAITEQNYFHQVDPEDAVAYFSSEDTWMPYSELMEHHFG